MKPKLTPLALVALMALVPALVALDALAAPMAPIEDKQGYEGTIVSDGRDVYGYADPDPDSEKEQSLTPGWKVEILNSTRGTDGQIWYRVRPPSDVTSWVPESQVHWD
jgi:hypothetical protein